MTDKEVYETWAPRGAAWSKWISPVPFTEIHCDEAPALEAVPDTWLSIKTPAAGTAMVVDLLGPEAVRRSMEFARSGFRPAPILNAAPAPGPRFIGDAGQRTLVDTVSVRRELRVATTELAALSMPLDAPPAFVLDASRMAAKSIEVAGRFDNRWIVYPQDFPSGAKLREHGISRVVVIQQTDAIAEDVNDVLCGWQSEGLEIFTRRDGARTVDMKVLVKRTSRLKLLWRRVLRWLGFKTNSDFLEFLNSFSSGTG
jgi:hypothetical protein